jgi:dimethylaniline monooxygenase (N-oxide forming)
MAIHRPVTGEVHSSIYQGTVFNSCRDTSSFSDFPMDPARYSVYTTHKQYVGYLHEYATFFDLLSHIRFGTKVMKCVQLEGGKWEVTYSEKEDIKTETYDALFACTGHNATPFIPEGLQRAVHPQPCVSNPWGIRREEGRRDRYWKFRYQFSSTSSFPWLTILTAVDISTELAPQAKGVHVITRTGGWIIPRFIFGKPVEAWDSTNSPFAFE